MLGHCRLSAYVQQGASRKALDSEAQYIYFKWIHIWDSDVLVGLVGLST